MSLTKFEYTKSWLRSSDFPTIETSEQRVRQDMQELPDQIMDGLNNLVDELESGGADGIGVSEISGLDGDTVQEVLESLNQKKVNAESGKGLSSNDYTSADKANVASNTQARHTHSNKSVLDGVTSAKVSSWDGKSEQAVPFEVELSTSWEDKAQTVSDSRFVADGYAYIVSPASESFSDWASAMIHADDVTVDGSMTFHCDSVPLVSIAVNILKIDV